jgi:hypothetical protein
MLYIMAVKRHLKGWFFGHLVIEDSSNQRDGDEKWLEI